MESSDRPRPHVVEVRFAETDAEIRACWPVLKQLRMSVDKEDELVKQVQRQQRQRGYRLVAGYGKAAREEEVVAVAGFTFRENLAAGRHMYVEDLVVDSNCRSRGVGTSLFAWLEQEAQKCGCDSIHLDSGLQRIDAHRFYEQQGMQYAAKYFFKAL